MKIGEIIYSKLYIEETIDTQSDTSKTGQVSVLEFDKKTLTPQENMTGVVELQIQGTKGQQIVIRHAETLDRDGNFYPETLWAAKSVDTYICSGGPQVFMSHFVFHSFRYIQVVGMDYIEFYINL